MRKNWNGAKWIRRERRLALYMRDGLACVWCGSSLEGDLDHNPFRPDGVTLSLDHVIPVSRGRTNGSKNLVTSCRKCNSVRGDRSLDEFACAVASYLNNGVTAQDITGHVLACVNRPVNLRAACRIMSKRANWQQALEEAKANGARKEEQR